MYKLLSVLVILIVSTFSTIFVENNVSENQISTIDTYGIKNGDVYQYQFIDNNSKSTITLSPGPRILIKDQDNLTITILSFNSSDPDNTKIQAKVNDSVLFAFCLCLPYFMPTNVLELIIVNGSVNLYGNVSYYDANSVVIQMINNQYHDVYEIAFQRKTGVMNYWGKYHVFDNGSNILTALKLKSNKTIDLSLQTTFSTETKIINSNVTDLSRISTSVINTNTIEGFQTITFLLPVILLTYIFRKRRMKST